MSSGKGYTEFYGQNVKEMPKLLAAGKVPGSVADIAVRRLKGEDYFIDNYFDTSDLLAYDSKKRSDKVKFILSVDNKGNITEKGREALELIHYDNLLTSDYGIKLGNEIYDSLKGDEIIEVSRNELGKLGQNLIHKERLNSKTWRILMRHPDEVPKEFAQNEGLLKDYSSWIDKKTRDTKNMGVYISNQTDDAKLKAWYLNRTVSRSNAYARSDLDNDNGRFVEFSGGAADKKFEKDLESKLGKDILSAISSGIAFEHNGFLYIPTTAKNIKLNK